MQGRGDPGPGRVRHAARRHRTGRGPTTRMDGFRATKALMASRPVTAIVATADILAFGAIDALRDRGLDAPADVTVTGYDDLPECSWMRPRLTTARQAITKGPYGGGPPLLGDQGRGPPSPSSAADPPHREGIHRPARPYRLVLRVRTAPHPLPFRWAGQRRPGRSAALRLRDRPSRGCPEHLPQG